MGSSCRLKVTMWRFGTGSSVSVEWKVRCFLVQLLSHNGTVLKCQWFDQTDTPPAFEDHRANFFLHLLHFSIERSYFKISNIMCLPLDIRTLTPHQRPLIKLKDLLDLALHVDRHTALFNLAYFISECSNSLIGLSQSEELLDLTRSWEQFSPKTPCNFWKGFYNCTLGNIH